MLTCGEGGGPNRKFALKFLSTESLLSFPLSFSVFRKIVFCMFCTYLNVTIIDYKFSKITLGWVRLHGKTIHREHFNVANK